jgi:FtsH-binding integral membrane protein
MRRGHCSGRPWGWSPSPRACSRPAPTWAAGYATRHDLSALARILFWALIGLILFGIVAIFVAIPNAALIYAILGLVIFAGLTAFDFQRLRRSNDVRTTPLLAASIFLDILNVFLLLLSLFGRGDD